MQAINKDVKEALHLIDQPFTASYNYSPYGTCFVYGTENQQGINDVIKYDGKDVITVASSGDQYLGAVYYGAKTVDLYDINKLTRYISFLKIAAIKSLSFKDFQSFFMPMTENHRVKKTFWNLKTLKRLLPSLPSDVGYFWENIMYEFNKKGYGNFVYPNSYCHNPEMIQNGMPFYLEESEYYKLQTILRHRDYPEFKNCDVFDLAKAFPNKYDIVYLSNILETIVASEVQSYPFASFSTEDRIESELLEKAENTIYKVGRENGTIMLSYRANSTISDSTDLFYNCVLFEANEIPRKYKDNLSHDDKPSTDIVLTYKLPSKRMNIRP